MNSNLNIINSLPGIVDVVTDGNDRRMRESRTPWIGIVRHHTGQGNITPADLPAWQRFGVAMSSWLTKKDAAYLSAHYLVHRDGKIEQLVNPEYFVAYHAGVSKHWHPLWRMEVSGMNDHMIGIEILGDGNKEPYSDEQYEALGKLEGGLYNKFTTIQPHCITGHEVISPGRKIDPGSMFDWRRALVCLTKNLGDAK
jgi:N-acetyl-anhydromuramyl-L-alanine amidase AmpD